jgi:hypothetical protein
VTEVKTTKNIAYKSSTCESVAHSFRKLLNKNMSTRYARSWLAGGT